MAAYADLSIFKRFEFEYQPVGVKFDYFRPRQLPPLTKKLAFCEMLKEAQGGESFYASEENHECRPGLIPLGQAEEDPLFKSGQIGPKLGVFDDARANRKIYTQMYKLEKDTVRFVRYAPLDSLDFDPDVFIVTASPSQAEIILRARSYRTGEPWNARGTTVMGCVYLYMYPYLTGELNMMITGLHHGMKARNVFPDGLLLLSIPYHILPEIADNLSVMEWDLPQYSSDKAAHIERMKRIITEMKSDD